jgi:hypothetical protein
MLMISKEKTPSCPDHHFLQPSPHGLLLFKANSAQGAASTASLSFSQPLLQFLPLLSTVLLPKVSKDLHKVRPKGKIPILVLCGLYQPCLCSSLKTTRKGDLVFKLRHCFLSSLRTRSFHQVQYALWSKEVWEHLKIQA